MLHRTLVLHFKAGNISCCPLFTHLIIAWYQELFFTFLLQGRWHNSNINFCFVTALWNAIFVPRYCKHVRENNIWLKIISIHCQITLQEKKRETLPGLGRACGWFGWNGMRIWGDHPHSCQPSASYGSVSIQEKKNFRLTLKGS